MRNKLAGYERLGRITQPIARKIGVRSADIYISKNDIRHIRREHQDALDKLGMTALAYVSFIVEKYNQIREGTDGSLILVVYNKHKKTQPAAAIQLVFLTKKGVWEVKTALVFGTTKIEKKKLLWECCPSTK